MKKKGTQKRRNRRRQNDLAPRSDKPLKGGGVIVATDRPPSMSVGASQDVQVGRGR